MSIKASAILEKIKSNKKFQYLIIIFFALLIIVFFYLTNLTKENSANLTNDEITSYVSSLENRLSSSLSIVEGAGKVSVVITIESGMETVIAMTTTTRETSNGTEITETPLLVNGKTVVLKELYPKVTGVLIVAEGANKIGVLTKLQQATISLLDISLNQIEILTMK